MSSIQLKDDEKKIDSWTLNYLPSFGGRYVGDLLITDQNVYFEADFSIEWTFDAVKPTEGGLSFSKENITAVRPKKSYWIFQRVEVELTDGTIHTFDRGAMSVAGIVEALGGEK